METVKFGNQNWAQDNCKQKFFTNGAPIIQVNSATGSGAILKPVIGPLSELKAEVTSQVDCIV